MAESYLSEIVADEQIKLAYENLQGVDPSSLSTLSSFYDTNIEQLKTTFTSSASSLGLGNTWDDSITTEFCGNTVSEVENILNACKDPALDVLNNTASDAANLTSESKSYLNEVDNHNYYYKNYQRLLSQEPQKNGDDDTTYESRMAAWRSEKQKYEEYLKTTYENAKKYEENCDALMDNIKANLVDISNITSVSKISISHEGITKAEAPKAVDETIEKQDTAAEIDAQARTTKAVPVSSRPGTVTVQTYTDPATGKTYKYRLFVPDGVTPDTKLPVTLYFDNGNNGIYELIRTGKLQAPGIVIYIDHSNANVGGGYLNDTFLEGMKNLTDEVVRTQNGDPNRISITGFSLGGQAAYKMTVKYPDYFAVSAPLSAKVSSKNGSTGDFKELIGDQDRVKWMSTLNQTPVVAFCGDGGAGGEAMHVTWRQKDLEEAMKQYGFDNFKLNVIHNLGHRTYQTFLQPYEGYNNVLEYLQAQVKTPSAQA